MKLTGAQIKKFFECSIEKNMRKNNFLNKGLKWGKLCEKIYIKMLKNLKQSAFEIVQEQINSNFNNLDIRASINIIKNLSSILLKMKDLGTLEFYKSNIKMENKKFSVEIDSILRDNSGYGFIREIKSYSGPKYYAWNSDIAQLTIQNIVFGSNYEIDAYYGEIVYLGNGKIIPINTRPYEKIVYFARKKILEHEKKISCQNCHLLEIPCYNHVRI